MKLIEDIESRRGRVVTSVFHGPTAREIESLHAMFEDGFVPIDAHTNWGNGHIVYIGYWHRFNPIENGMLAPDYTVTMENEGGKISVVSVEKSKIQLYGDR